MAEYIDRDALLKHNRYISSDRYEIECVVDIDRIIEAPAEDVAPVVHGKWVAVPSSDLATGKAYKCSNCKKMRYGSYLPAFCQVCGAKMDLEE